MSIVAELLARLNRIENKRESFRAALIKPKLPTTLKSRTRALLTLDAALADKDVRQNFREYVQAAYALENLDFFEAVTKCESLPAPQRLEQGRRIVAEFVVDHSQRQVNLPSPLVTQLVQSSSERELMSHLIQAKKEIESLIQVNFLDRFLDIVGLPALVACPENTEEEGELGNLEADWVVRKHPKTGDVYYENTVTGVTMWTRPQSSIVHRV